MLAVARGEKAVSKAQEALSQYTKQKEKIEKKHLEEAEKISKEGAADRVKSMSKEPLAVPALKKLLQDPNRALRQAAVAALGENPATESIEILIGALAEEGDAGLGPEIAAILKRKANGPDFGTRAQEWEAWHFAQIGRRLQGLVTDAGGGVIEWRIVNLSSKSPSQWPVRLDQAFGPRFKVTTADGRELPMSIDFEAPAVRRGLTATLKPGQFVGGRMPLKNLVDLAGR